MAGVSYSCDKFAKLVSTRLVLCFYLWNHLPTLPKDDVQFHYDVIHFVHCKYAKKVDKVVGGNTIGLFGKVVYPRWLSTYRTPPLNTKNLTKIGDLLDVPTDTVPKQKSLINVIRSAAEEVIGRDVNDLEVEHITCKTANAINNKTGNNKSSWDKKEKNKNAVWHVPFQDTLSFTPNPETVQSFPFERECPELDYIPGPYLFESWLNSNSNSSCSIKYSIKDIVQGDRVKYNFLPSLYPPINESNNKQNSSNCQARSELFLQYSSKLWSAFLYNFSIKDGFCVTLHNKEGTKLADNLCKKYLSEYFPYINPERVTALYVPQKGELTFQTRFNMVSETNIPMDQAAVYKGYLYTEEPEESQPVVVKIETGDNKGKALYDLTAD